MVNCLQEMFGRNGHLFGFSGYAVDTLSLLYVYFFLEPHLGCRDCHDMPAPRMDCSCLYYYIQHVGSHDTMSRGAN